jgi:DedD protein
VVEQIVKQRVVGAVVLVALAVIFIPALLEGPDHEPAPEALDIPASMNDLREGSIEPLEPVQQTLIVPPEAVTTVVIEAPTPGAQQASAAVPEAEPVEAEVPAAAPVAQPQSPATIAATPAAGGWVVQVGAFGQEANAMGLRDRLRKAGFAAFVEKVTLATGSLYRVRVGPETERADAEALQQQLAKNTGLKGKLMSHP